MQAMINTRVIPKLELVYDEDGPVSVTNDAEAVVEFVLQKNHWNPDVRILYCDTDGQWDELQHDGTKFVSFRIWGQRSWQAIVTDPRFAEG